MSWSYNSVLSFRRLVTYKVYTDAVRVYDREMTVAPGLVFDRYRNGNAFAFDGFIPGIYLIHFNREVNATAVEGLLKNGSLCGQSWFQESDLGTVARRM